MSINDVPIVDLTISEYPGVGMRCPEIPRDGGTINIIKWTLRFAPK